MATSTAGPSTTRPVTVRAHGPCFDQGVFQFHSWPVMRTVITEAGAADRWRLAPARASRPPCRGRAVPVRAHDPSSDTL